VWRRPELVAPLALLLSPTLKVPVFAKDGSKNGFKEDPENKNKTWIRFEISLNESSIQGKCEPNNM
jgi:hypothetical protein